MNSNGIQPRVGMQVRYISRESEHWPKKISKITEIVRFDDRQYCWLPGQGGDWDQGNYEIEWIPPTDEERVMFADAAKHFRERDNGCVEICNHHGELIMLATNSDDACAICESLSLDGMDIDDVSKIEELMR